MPPATPASTLLLARRVSRRTIPGAGPGAAAAGRGSIGGGGGWGAWSPGGASGGRSDMVAAPREVVASGAACSPAGVAAIGDHPRRSPTRGAVAQGRPPWPGGPARATMAPRHPPSLEASSHGDSGPSPAGQLAGHRPQPRQPRAAWRGRRARRAARRRPGPGPGRLRRAGHRRRLRGRALPAGLGDLGRAGRRGSQVPAGPAAGGQAGLRPRAGRARDDAAAP